jgi:hypothetical protein
MGGLSVLLDSVTRLMKNNSFFTVIVKIVLSSIAKN